MGPPSRLHGTSAAQMVAETDCPINGTATSCTPLQKFPRRGVVTSQTEVVDEVMKWKFFAILPQCQRSQSPPWMALPVLPLQDFHKGCALPSVLRQDEYRPSVLPTISMQVLQVLPGEALTIQPLSKKQSRNRRS